MQLSDIGKFQTTGYEIVHGVLSAIDSISEPVHVVHIVPVPRTYEEGKTDVLTGAKVPDGIIRLDGSEHRVVTELEVILEQLDILHKNKKTK
jgi:hypothetical protein